MPRPMKWRRVEFIPENHLYFAPCPKGRCPKVEDIVDVEIKIEELEAIRLKDIEGLSQSEAAEKMSVSRQTFQNILEVARKKVATALVEGKALAIGGGHYTVAKCKKCEKKCDKSCKLND
ncbi:putative DNA-binding protein (UPF0251 family) [Desulfitispora alkaliphila]|uniref:DUF134 domain-containing protein n=1 Tax=Desulfitispora alkaliphila TaxID=622674 RepID=UPI003D1C8BE2